MKKEFTKAYEPARHEDGIYKRWEKSGYFQPGAGQPRADNQKETKGYSIAMPPPNVTGNLHLGHAAMLAIEDILIRYHRMKGNKTLWVPGTDHAAIATQAKVEKLLKDEGANRHKLGREKFLKRVEKYAQDSHDTIVNQVKKMGCSCDWSREAYTLDETRTKAVRAVFKMMYEDGLIYRGERIVNWCPRCHSTLADDEVEYKSQKTKFYTFKYFKDFPFAISTTRPETKLGDTAVAVNPSDKRYKQYVGKVYTGDFVGVKLKLKIIADRQVDKDFGTGALGVTPAHSAVDWQMAEENSLKVIKVIDEEGGIKSGFGKFSKKKVDEAREMIVEELTKQGLLEKEEEMENNLSLCYRCNTPIEPLPSLQWFINVNKKIPKYKKSIKELSIDAVKKGVLGRDKIKIVPERFEKNYFHWMENLRDWCISRQIWFGHRVPVWYGQKSEDGEVYVGVEPPKGKDWKQDEDTLDTWFSSGLWTFSTLANSPEQIKIKKGKIEINSKDFKNFHPTAVLETGYDILFFWVARMIIMTTYAVGDIPFQDVYLHGLIRDEKGRKMSKSLGNVIDPLDMIKKYGTDAVRLSLVIGTTPGNDMNLSEAKVAGFRNFANKLWNISRYILQTTDDRRQTTEMTDADNWILEELEDTISSVDRKLKNYEFSQAGELLRVFTWEKLADWYLEIAKIEGNKSAILRNILEKLLILWHPFIPYVTEVIWSQTKDKNDKMLIVKKWPKAKRSKAGEYMNKKWGLVQNKINLIIEIITAIRNARAENKVEPKRKVKAMIYAGKYKELINSQTDLIKGLRTGIEELEVKGKGPKIKNEIYINVNGIDIYLIGAIDKAKEKKRLKKKIDNLGKLISGAERKLANKKFVSKAPKEVVKREKENLKMRKQELNNLEKQIKEFN